MTAKGVTKYPLIPCMICGHDAHPKKKTGCCSRACWVEKSRRERQKECPICKKYFTLQYVESKQQTCGLECKSEMWRLETRSKFRGENHPGWKTDRDGVSKRKALKLSCHGFIRNAIKRIPTYELDIVQPELGWSARQLAEHLEPLFLAGMTWENHARTGWHIDHIRPISSFPIGTPLSEINALDNLQPLWYADNIRKSNKWPNELSMKTET